MHDALFVRGFDAFGDLLGDVQRLIDGKRAALETPGEILALDQFHRQEALAALLMQAVDRGDVGVVQRGQQLGLAFEAGQPLGAVGEDLREQFDRDVAVERRVGGAPDRTHPALTDLLGQLVVQQSSSGFAGHTVSLNHFRNPRGRPPRSWP